MLKVHDCFDFGQISIIYDEMNFHVKIVRKLTPCWSVLEFLKIKLVNSSLTNWILACKNQFRNWFWQAKNQVRRTWFFQLDFSKFKYRSKGGKYIGRLGRSVEEDVRYFRVFFVVQSAQILSLCLIRDFALFFFCKQLIFSYILQDFLFGIGIWFWAVENLGSSHHMSVVRAYT